MEEQLPEDGISDRWNTSQQEVYSRRRAIRAGIGGFALGAVTLLAGVRITVVEKCDRQHLPDRQQVLSDVIDSDEGQEALKTEEGRRTLAESIIEHVRKEDRNGS